LGGKTKMTEKQALVKLREIRTEVYNCVNQTKWKYGEALFNVVAFHYPVFTETIRGSSIDCFERTEVVPEFEKALIDWLITNY
jgi:hypothetical protein